MRTCVEKMKLLNKPKGTRFPELYRYLFEGTYCQAPIGGTIYQMTKSNVPKFAQVHII